MKESNLGGRRGEGRAAGVCTRGVYPVIGNQRRKNMSRAKTGGCGATEIAQLLQLQGQSVGGKYRQRSTASRQEKS